MTAVDELCARFAVLDAYTMRCVFAYLAGRHPESAAEALRLNEPDPADRPRAAGGSGG